VRMAGRQAFPQCHIALRRACAWREGKPFPSATLRSAEK
jgi:hypothetical protein